MKNFITLAISILVMSFSTQAKTEDQQNYIVGNNYGTSYIFTEHNIEFSVFPDGQFDFTYVGGYDGNAVCVSVDTPHANINFNSGYDYDIYVQYDDYGAVIQIENIPIYYDMYGRIIQAGGVNIHYRNRRIVRVGDMYVHYNRRGYFSHYTGYINSWNTHYVYRPWHVYYARPFYNNCIVYDYAYRVHYIPVRYDFHHHRTYYRTRGHNNSYRNGRRAFYRPGSRVHHRDGRVVANRDYQPNRRNNAATLNKRRGDVNNKPQKRVATNNTTTRRANSKEKANSRRVANTNTTINRGKPVSRTNVVSKRKSTSTVNRSNKTVSRGAPRKSATVTRKANKKVVSRTPVKRKANSSRKVAKTTTKRSVSRGSSTRSKGTVTRRTRG